MRMKTDYIKYVKNKAWQEGVVFASAISALLFFTVALISHARAAEISLRGARIDHSYAIVWNSAYPPKFDQPEIGSTLDFRGCEGGLRFNFTGVSTSVREILLNDTARAHGVCDAMDTFVRSYHSAAPNETLEERRDH